MNDPAPAKPRLSVRHLSVLFRARGLLAGLRQGRVLAVDDLHLDLRQGETIGFAGESGCGKSALARALAGLTPMTGSVRCDGEELCVAGSKDTRALQRTIQLIEQTPLAGLKPRRRVGELLGTALRERHPKLEAAQRDAHIAALLARVGLAPEVLEKQLKQLDAATRARLALVRALCLQPKVLLCDAPEGGLDAEQRESFVELVVELARQFDLALVLFAREPLALRGHCSRLLTMTLGKVMEQAPTDALLDAPRHPYTRALLEQAGADEPAKAPPPLQHAPMGCVFHPRCPLAEAACVRSEPHLRRVGPEHYAACHFLG